MNRLAKVVAKLWKLCWPSSPHGLICAENQFQSLNTVSWAVMSVYSKAVVSKRLLAVAVLITVAQDVGDKVSGIRIRSMVL